MYDFNIKNSKANEIIQGAFIISSVKKDVTKTNKDFLSITLKNKNGEISCKLWDAKEEDYDMFSNNNILLIKGIVNEYNGNKQIVIKDYKKSTNVDISKLIVSTDKNVEEMYSYLYNTAKLMDDTTLRILTTRMLEDNKENFIKYGAAKIHHHSIVGGLLQHTYDITRSAEQLMVQYGSKINKDLLLSSAILHDIGKLKEFKTDDFGMVSDYTAEGELLGHITLGIQMITEYKCKLMYTENITLDENVVLLLSHIILSHHGQPDFGSPKHPMIKEAELISYLDMIDTKMFMFDDITSGLNENEFSQRQWSLDNRKIYKY